MILLCINGFFTVGSAQFDTKETTFDKYNSIYATAVKLNRPGFHKKTHGISYD